MVGQCAIQKSSRNDFSIIVITGLQVYSILMELERTSTNLYGLFSSVWKNTGLWLNGVFWPHSNHFSCPRASLLPQKLIIDVSVTTEGNSWGLSSTNFGEIRQNDCWLNFRNSTIDSLNNCREGTKENNLLAHGSTKPFRFREIVYHRREEWDMKPECGFKVQRKTELPGLCWNSWYT